MSKRKILSAFQEGLEQLSSALPEESREPLKKLERAFVEMRQRHSESERRRQEAEELCRKQQETITALETYRTEMDAALHQRSQIVDRLRRLLAERISGQTSCEKIENVRRQFEPAMFDLAERLGFNTKERWDFLAVEFNRTVVPHYQKHSHVLADELNFFKHLLMLCCRQYGPLDLMEEEVGRGESFLRWKYRDGRWHLELVASDQEEQTEEEKATGPTGSNPA